MRPLGRGASAQVWEAVLVGPHGFEKPVALKILEEASPTGVELFLREARIGARLAHPNLVGTFDLGTAEGRWYLAMELVRGPTAHDLAGSGPLEPRAVLEIGIQVAAALGAVHAAGLVHRDVKPSNVLVEARGLVRLADLGIARLVDTPGRPAGTPAYMPPEQLDGREEPRSDLFALATSLIKLATRAPWRPGRGPPRVEDVAARLADPSLCATVEAALPGAWEVLRRCLDPEPARRPADAAAVEAALRAVPAWRGVGGGLGRRVPSAPVSAPVATPPAPRDAYFGAAARADLARRLGGPDRLLTLVGPGGIGKTRLAVEVARAAGPGAFVDASRATTRLDLEAAVSHAIGAGDAPIGASLSLRGRFLLVLDNLEQVVGPAAERVADWLDAAPELTVLCTSRRALGVAGERRVPVAPLAEEEAIALFVDRSGLPDADTEVPRLVRALEGSPLGIELAAARARTLGTAAVARRLGDRLRLLASAEGGRPARHASLRASLDVSWGLLSEGAREALAQVAVFEAAFSLEAAEAVVRTTGPGWVLDAVEELAEASLLAGDGPRLRLSVAVRQYAQEVGPSSLSEAARERHLDWFAQIGAGVLCAPVDRATLLPDTDDLVAACGFAIGRGRVRPALSALEGAVRALEWRGPHALGVDLAEAVRRLPGATPAERGTAAVASAQLRFSMGDLAGAEARATEALASPDPRVRTWALRILCGTARRTERLAVAEDHLRALEALVAELGDRHETFGVLRAKGALLVAQGAVRAAIAVRRRALDLAEELGDPGAVRLAQGDLAVVLDLAEQWEEAASLHARRIAAHEDAGDALGAALARAGHGRHLVARGAFAEGIAVLDAVVRRYTDLGHASGVALETGNLSLAHAGAGRWEEALACANRQVNAYGRLGHAVPLARARLRRCLTALTMGAFEVADDDLAASCSLPEGAEFDAIRVRSSSMAGDLALRRGDAARARELLGRAAGAARAAGLRFEEARALEGLGQVELDAGNLESARAAFRSARALGDGATVAQARAQLALADARGGDLQAWERVGDDRPERALGGLVHLRRAECARHLPEVAARELRAARERTAGLRPTSWLVRELARVEAALAAR